MQDLTIGSLLGIITILGCLLIIQIYQTIKSKGDDEDEDQQEIWVVRAVTALSTAVLIVASLFGYFDGVDNHETVVLTIFYYLSEFFGISLLFYSYWRFGESITTTFYRVLQRNNDVIPITFHTTWKGIILLIIAVYFTLVAILCINFSMLSLNLVLFRVLYLILDIFCIVTQIGAVVVVGTLRQPVKLANMIQNGSVRTETTADSNRPSIVCIVAFCFVLFSYCRIRCNFFCCFFFFECVVMKGREWSTCRTLYRYFGKFTRNSIKYCTDADTI